jgi:hypothetical protein
MNRLILKGKLVNFCNLWFIPSDCSHFLLCSRHVGEGIKGAFITKCDLNNYF